MKRILVFPLPFFLFCLGIKSVKFYGYLMHLFVCLSNHKKKLKLGMREEKEKKSLFWWWLKISEMKLFLLFGKLLLLRRQCCYHHIIITFGILDFLPKYFILFFRKSNDWMNIILIWLMQRFVFIRLFFSKMTLLPYKGMKNQFRDSHKCITARNETKFKFQNKKHR